jgi:hypothetical protein
MCALTDVHVCENYVVGWYVMTLEQQLCLLWKSLLFFGKSQVRNIILVMLIVGCTSKDGRPAKSARRSDREDKDMTHAYL